MTAGTLKQIKQFLPKNDKETLYFAIAFFAGVAVSWMFLKKKNEKKNEIEEIKNQCGG